MIQAQREPLAAVRPATEPDARRPGLRVLFVEEDDGEAYLIERALHANPDVGGVLRAADGIEAIRLVRAGAIAPDLALIDLQAPRRTGLEALVEFAAHTRPRLPMVVLTPSNAPPDAGPSELSGLQWLMVKPDSADAYPALLATAIHRARAGAHRQARRVRPKRR